jgi:hypothetical protein
MSLAEQIARSYFDASNQSDLIKIAELLSVNCSYYSVSLGFFMGKKEVIAMQSDFHGQYQSLEWSVDHLTEIKPNIIEIAFSFKGLLQDGTEQNRQGSEHILLYAGLIHHVAVGL